MKKTILILININFSILVSAQNVIKLPYENPKGITWPHNEKEYYLEAWKIKVVTNISAPTMEVFRPADSISNRTAVIIAPGGGMFFNSIKNEGSDVAKWLNKKGITAFVLKY